MARQEGQALENLSLTDTGLRCTDNMQFAGKEVGNLGILHVLDDVQSLDRFKCPI
jgi:hypothetical protein